MRVHQILVISLLLCGCLSGCNSSDGDREGVMPTTLSIPSATRHIMSLDNSRMRLNIHVNVETWQTFTIQPGQSTISIDLQGVRLGESNTIKIVWVEFLNGYDVEIASQTQTFVAEGNVVIDAAHSGDQFDYDRDGQSNYAERLAGTCVWSANESCMSDGVSDVPPDSLDNTNTAQQDNNIGANDILITPSYIQSGTNVSASTINTGTSTIVDDDFSGGISDWFRDGVTTVEDGAMCTVFREGSIGNQETLSYYNDTIRMVSGTYVAQFDLRVVERADPVALSIYTTPDFDVILGHYVQGTRGWQTHTIRFDNSIASSAVGFGFNVLRSASPTTYCFDNFKIVKL